MLALASTDNIQVITSSANALDVAAAWADNAAASFTPGRTTTAIAAAATTTVVAAPAAATTRNVSNLSFYARGGANTITPQTTGGTTVQYGSVALAASERLEYENGKGWSVYDAAGQFKQSIAAAAGSIALTSLATQAANTIVANATGGVASPTAVAVSAQAVLLRAAGNLTDTTAAASTALTRGAAGNLGFQTVELATLATQAANTMIANATAGVAALTAVAVAAQSLLVRAAANIVAVTAAAGQSLGRNLAGNLGFYNKGLVASNTTIPTATNATTNLSAGGSYSIPAASLEAGSVYRTTCMYEYVHTAAVTPTITIEYLINAVVIAAVTLVKTPINAAATYSGTIHAYLRCQTTGAGGTCVVSIDQKNTYETFALGAIQNALNAATTAIDTTVARTIELRLRMTTAVAANTLNITQGFVEAL